MDSSASVRDVRSGKKEKIKKRAQGNKRKLHKKKPFRVIHVKNCMVQLKRQFLFVLKRFITTSSIRTVQHDFIFKEIDCTVFPRSSHPFYTVTYYIKLVTTSWTYSTIYILDLKMDLGKKETDQASKQGPLCTLH